MLAQSLVIAGRLLRPLLNVSYHSFFFLSAISDITKNNKIYEDNKNLPLTSADTLNTLMNHIITLQGLSGIKLKFALHTHLLNFSLSHANGWNSERVCRC
jgi:hypothetical protein